MTEYVNQCARCGSSLFFTDCIDCDGAGYEEGISACEACDGDGFIAVCMSTWEWCADHPLPGKEWVSRGTVQGVEVGGRPAAADLPVQGEPGA